MKGVTVRYWLLLLRKPGQWMEFDAADFGVKVDTLVNYIDIENMRSGGRYKSCSMGGTRVGVRRVNTGNGGDLVRFK